MRTSVKDEIVELELGHGGFLGFYGGTHALLVERILGLAPVCSRQDVANRLGAVAGLVARSSRMGRLNLVDWALIWDLAQIDILSIRVLKCDIF